MSRNFKFTILILLLFTGITGCGGKIILSDDAVRIRKISEFVNELKDLYEQHDEQVLSLFSQEYLSTTKEMRSDILTDMKRFSGISLSFFIDRIEMNDDHVNISIHWNGTWKDAEKTYQEGGSVVLLTSYGDSILITGMRGDSPFGVSPMFDSHEN